MIHDRALDELIDEQRRVMATLGDAAPPAPAASSLLSATDHTLPGKPRRQVRVIRPPGEVRGALLHIHGGGFVVGNPQMADGMNSYLAREASVVVVSVDYRLAPANPHPAALEDCVRAALWLIEGARAQLKTERLLIAGDSVGATLAVMTLIELRDQHEAAKRFCGASLNSGVYDFGQTPSQRMATASMFLSPARLRGMPEAAFPGVSGEDLRDARYSPLYARLHGLPPAIFSVGGHDSVLDDTLFIAQRWRAAGNAAELEVYPEAPHTFMNLPTAMAAEARWRVSRFLAACLRR
jgi:acetyl esterase/lipase